MRLPRFMIAAALAGSLGSTDAAFAQDRDYNCQATKPAPVPLGEYGFLTQCQSGGQWYGAVLVEPWDTETNFVLFDVGSEGCSDGEVNECTYSTNLWDKTTERPGRYQYYPPVSQPIPQISLYCECVPD